MLKLIEWLISMVAVVAIYLLMIGLFVAFWSAIIIGVAYAFGLVTF